MAAENTTSTLVGNFKEVYGDDIKGLAPNTLKVTKQISFEKGEALGGKYHQPVDLTMEHGVTYAAANASSITLLDPVAGQMQDAQVEGAQVFARSRVDYESIYKASQAGAKAFAKATKHVVKRLTAAAAKRLEILTLHGRRGIGTISSVSGSSTTRDWVITGETWAAAIWAGGVNATLDVWNSGLSAKQNSNAKVVITAVNVGTKTISVSGNATDLTAIAAGMVVFFESGGPTNEFAGMDAIIRNTGTLFNVSASTYELWKGNVVSSVGRISMQAILNGISRAVELGLEDDVVCIVSPKAFEVLNSDFAALRASDASYEVKKGEAGVEGLVYHGQSGKVEILPHFFQKDGQAFVVALKEWKRIGATDLTFVTRHGSEDKLILELPNSPYSEMRCYFNGALFCEAPAHQVVLDGITYS